MIHLELRFWLLLLVFAVFGCRKSEEANTPDSLVPDELRALLSSVPHSQVNLDEAATDTAYLVQEIGGVDEKAERPGDIFLGRPTGFVKLGDSIYICDRAENCIVVADNHGRLVRRIGRKGAGPLEFNYPAQIVSDGEHVLVHDFMNARVQMFSRDFRYLFSGVASFPSPVGPTIAVTNKHVVLRGNMADTNCIRVYDRADLSAPLRTFLPFNTDFGNLKIALKDSVLAVAFVVLPSVMFFRLDGTLLHVVDLSGKDIDAVMKINVEAKRKQASARVHRETHLILSLRWLDDETIAFEHWKCIYILSCSPKGWLLTKKYVCIDRRAEANEVSATDPWRVMDFEIQGGRIYVCYASIGVFEIR